MHLQVNQIISYWEMCEAEGHRQLQRGMYFQIESTHSVLLMSIKSNAPYEDKISEDGFTIYYEGHDQPGDKLKQYDQTNVNPGGTLTQNGLFKSAIDDSRESGQFPLARVYEKLQKGIWTYRGLFEISDYLFIQRGRRNVYEFVLTITEQELSDAIQHHKSKNIDLEQTRQIPGRVKLAVYVRDKGMCTICSKKDNLHFDHILPYSKGGTSLNVDNIQLLCSRHNLEKSAKLDY